MGVFGLRHFLESFDLGLDVRSVLFVLPTSSIQGALRLIDRSLPSLSFLLPGGLFLRAFALAALLLLLESERGISVSRLVGGLLRMPLRLAAQQIAGSGLLRSALANKIDWQLGALLEGPARAYGTLQNDARRLQCGNLGLAANARVFVTARVST
jgi:hypothetical protein